MKKSLLALAILALMAATSLASAVNFGMPIGRTLAFSTAHQAADPTAAAVINVTVQCEGGDCILEVRMGSTSALDCANGTALAELIGSGSFVKQWSDIKLPIGAWFILCPTFGQPKPTIIEQSII
jgi:hypothetical protein